MQHMLRFACNQGYDKWNFWLEVDVNQPEVWLDVAASLLEPSDAIREFVSHLGSCDGSLDSRLRRSQQQSHVLDAVMQPMSKWWGLTTLTANCSSVMQL